MSETLLRVNHLSVGVQMGKGIFHAVGDISFQINRGEILGLIGESGCGKSLTALAIAGLLPPKTVSISAGEIIYGGVDLRKLTREEMRKIQGREIAMVFQEPMTAFNPLLPIGKQIGESLKNHFALPASQVKAEVLRVLGKVGLPASEDFYYRYPHQLSGGMRQRAMIAMAVICQPGLVIADEPTTALDVTIQAQIIELLKEINRQTETTILFISHDLGIVSGFCDRVAVIYGGNIVEEGNVPDLFFHPVHEYTKGLLGAIPGREKRGQKLANIPGRIPPLTEEKSGCPFAPRCAKAVARCFLEKPPLVSLRSGQRVYCHLAGKESETEYARI